MSAWKRRHASILGGLLPLAFACGGPPAETTTPTQARPPDKTEVTMEKTSLEDAGAEPSTAGPSSTAIATIAPATTSSDPSEDPNIGGPQEPAIEKAVAPVRPRLRACYKKALAAEPGIAGTATFDATIGKDGKVASARFVKRDGLNEDMVGCLLASVKAMTFNTSQKSQIVALAFGAGRAGGGDAGAKR